MKKLFVLLIFVFCLLALNGYAQDRWIFVGENDEIVLYYDNETIKYDRFNLNNSVTVYLKFVYKSDYSLKVGIDFSISKIIFYCDEYKYRSVSRTEYYNDGRIKTFSHVEYEDIVPETSMEAVYRLLCR